jgi:hypothetical protein
VKWILQAILKSRVTLVSTLLASALVSPCQQAWSEPLAHPGIRGSQETVEGQACYTYGDNETPAQAKRAAVALAQEQAVRMHRVFVQSATKVKNFQLEDDVIQSASAALLERVQVKKEEKRGQEICITITAVMSPVSMEEMIRQRINAKEISQTAESVIPQAPPSGTKIWTNKSNGRFIENDRLIIYVQSDRDTYLKLDYFQADGTVVHMVPNQFRGQGIVKAGRVYAFGDETSPEQFTIQGPFGAETIKAIFSARPFESGISSTSVISDSREYLQALAGSRGLKVDGTSQSISLNTVSKTVEEYKKERKASVSD